MPSDRSPSAIPKLAILALAVATLPPFIDKGNLVILASAQDSPQDPSFCVRNRTEDYSCNCYRCCDKCDCHVKGRFWHHCNGCGHCWCSPGCHCCGHDCCKDCCQTCHRVVCDSLITYHVSGLSPTYGPVTGGTVVQVSGGTYSNIGNIKCRFGAVEVPGEMISGGEIRCTSPPQSADTRDVAVEISLDGGIHYTSNGKQFKYHNCPGGGTCNENGVCHPDSTCTCNRGYFGTSCSYECPGGASSPCLGRTASNTCNSQGNCTCQNGYFGTMCENECPGGAASPCNGQGRCLSSGECQCNTGWVGLNCTRQGTCQGEECQCSGGYWGPNCQNECVGGHQLNCGNGTCGRDGKCYCETGYYGDTCTAICPGGRAHPCNGRGEQGTCSRSTGTCHCQNGYFGNACEHECSGGAANPCSGHGTCSPIDGHCMCDKGWAGANCSIECPGGASNPCNGRGTCDIDTGMCSCNSTHFYGSSCENVCDCDGRGLCDERGECTCVNGYFGETCQMECPSYNGVPCSNHGVCVYGYPPSCSCNSGWWGAICQYLCPGGATTPCSNNGICLGDGTCKCNPGFSGQSCEVRDCPYNCHNNGECRAGVCRCRPGFVAPFCSVPPPDEPSMPENRSEVHGRIGFLRDRISVEEYVENVYVQIARTVGVKGNVSATVSGVSLSADKGVDWYMDDQNPSWAEGENSLRNISLTIIQDGKSEGAEFFTVRLVGIEGGAISGDITEVVVEIRANNASASVIAYEFKFTLTKTMGDLPPNSRARVDFYSQFNDEWTSFLGVSRRRFQVEDLQQDPKKGAVIKVLLLPNPSITTAAQQIDEINGLVKNVFNLCSNQTSEIYTKGRSTRYIDIRFPPEVMKRTPPPPPSDPHSNQDGGASQLSPGGIAGAVIGSVVGAALIGVSAFLCYKRRQQVVEWLLWKLGSFRFKILREKRWNRDLGDGDNDDVISGGGAEMECKSRADGSVLGYEDEFDADSGSRIDRGGVLGGESIAEAKDGNNVSGKGSGEEEDDGVGTEAFDSMPMPDDF